MDKEQALQAMKDGHKITHIYFSDDEHLSIINNIITSEEGYNFNDWWHDNTEQRKWTQTGWSIKQ